MTATLLLANEEISLENDFLQSLNEVSEIATKTKLNIDDSPSFVTVLHQKKLQKLGIETVFEAMRLVPGVQLTREGSGVPVVVFRGVTQKGEVKLMLDGVTINNSYRGSIYHYLDFPVDLIERIEVIRGAGSVLYGSGAISGVINIITKSSNTSNTNLAFLSGATHNNYRAGTFFATQLQDINVAVDAYYHDTDKMLETTDRHLRDYSIGLNVNNGTFGLLARIRKSDQGNAYGILGVRDADENKYNNINDTGFAQFSYKDKLTQTNTIEVLAGVNKYIQEIEAEHPSLNVGAIDAAYKERSYYAQADLISTSLKNNNLLVGARFESAKTLQSEQTVGNPVSKPNQSRDIASLYAVNNFTASPSLDISAGLRYDKYSDFGSSFSPTVGLIYRASKSVKLKALYSQAFRAPSWVELTSNPDLEAETSTSYEAGIIYKQNHKNTLRVNLYSLKIQDMITKDATYVQNSRNDFHGIELEYIYIPINSVELNIFASFVDAEDDEGKDLTGIANTLAAATLVYQTKLGIKFGSYLKYVSGSKRDQNDLREDMSSSLIFDETISYDFKNFRTSLVLKDIFNEGTYYALPKDIDFYDAGRSFILKAIWEY